MEIKKSKSADLENKRWIGFVLGLIVASSIFYVAMEYSIGGDSEDDKAMDLKKELVLNNQDMMPAIDEQDLAKEQKDEKPTMEDMLNLKRSDTPQKVTPHEVGNTTSNDEKTTAPQVRDVALTTTNTAALPDPPKPIEEIAKEVKNKFTDDDAEEKVERVDDKVNKHILSQTPTPPGGWSNFVVWLTETIKYPPTAIKANQQGVVNVTFIINADGTVSDVKVKKAKNTAFDLEVLRVVRTMGRWKPAKEHNKPCRSLVEIPIVFQIA